MSKREILIIAIAAIVGLAIRLCLPRMEAPASRAAAEGTNQQNIAAVFRSLSPTTMPAKPWMVQTDQFIREHGGEWVIGRSSSPCLSEAQAAEEANADAMRQISSQLPHDLAAFGRDADWIGVKVMSDVRAGALEVDHVPESFARPYGTIWAESVLLDTSSQRLGKIVEGYVDQLRVRRLHTAWLRGGAVILAAAGWLMYGVINLLTLGYFTARLRLIATAVTIAAVILII
jgi:hypothetical protein